MRTRPFGDFMVTFLNAGQFLLGISRCLKGYNWHNLSFRTGDS